MARIGFVGLGNMGAHMVRNLLKAGHEVTVFDLVPAAIASVTPNGAKAAPNAAEAARGAEYVITMLPAGQHVRDAWLGAGAMAAASAPDALLIDCSTIDVATARDVAEKSGRAFVDAPVSGGIGGAAAGTLTFMAGGSEEAFAKVAPLFEIMGQKAVHCGDSGAGQAAKICNNMILGVTMIATCEAFALADKLGLDRQKMYDVVSTSSGYSWTMNAYTPAPGIGAKSPADNDYKPGFASELMLKDLNLSQMAAEATDADTPMGAAATALYKTFVEDEGGLGRDFSAMLPRFSARSRKDS